MTKKTKDDLRKELESLKTMDHSITVTTQVVEITDDMTDENGRLIESQMPDPDPPDGRTLGGRVSTQSPVCDWYKLVPADE